MESQEENKGARWFRIIVILVVLIAAASLLSFISDVVKILIISALLAFVLDPLALLLESRGMSRTLATVVLFCTIIAAGVIAVLLLIPLFFGDITAIQINLDSAQTTALIEKIEHLIEKDLSFLGMKDIHLMEKIQKSIGSLGEWFVNHLLDMASLMIDVFLIPFITFFFLKDGRAFKKAFVSMVPNKYFEFTLRLISNLETQVSNFLRGQLMDAMFVGVLSTIALWILGVKYFLFIGVFAGLANFMPYFGPIVGAALAVLVSLLNNGNFETVFSVILAFAVVKLIDDMAVQPYIVGKSVNMHPLIVLLVIIIGGKFFGILGMFLSVPAAGFIKVVLQESIVNLRKYKAI
ncbi:MAG: AI-2E family transporter [Thermodesulfovibrionia bacterium]|nr:AI-2E family transporter [Thermodesulfovibrionia bacterium]